MWKSSHWMSEKKWRKVFEASCLNKFAPFHHEMKLRRRCQAPSSVVQTNQGEVWGRFLHARRSLLGKLWCCLQRSSILLPTASLYVAADNKRATNWLIKKIHVFNINQLHSSVALLCFQPASCVRLISYVCPPTGTLHTPHFTTQPVVCAKLNHCTSRRKIQQDVSRGSDADSREKKKKVQTTFCPVLINIGRARLKGSI